MRFVTQNSQNRESACTFVPKKTPETENRIALCVGTAPFIRKLQPDRAFVPKNIQNGESPCCARQPEL